MKTISPITLKAQLDAEEDLFLLDIRENYERELSFIPSSHIPMAEVCSQLEDLPRDITVVLICKSGRRAAALANLLTRDFNLTNIYVLEGGLGAWKESVDPEFLLDN